MSFDPPQPHQPQEELVIPPVPVLLGRKAEVKQLDLAPRVCLRHRDVVRRWHQIGVPLRDLVVQDQGVAPNGAGQLSDESMVLVGVVDPRDEEHIWFMKPAEIFQC
jgi:hypothetical protein